MILLLFVWAVFFWSFPLSLLLSKRHMDVKKKDHSFNSIWFLNMYLLPLSLNFSPVCPQIKHSKCCIDFSSFLCLITSLESDQSADSTNSFFLTLSHYWFLYPCSPDYIIFLSQIVSFLSAQNSLMHIFTSMFFSNTSFSRSCPSLTIAH